MALKNSLQRRVSRNYQIFTKIKSQSIFLRRYDHFKIIPFCYCKDYLVTFCNTNIGRKRSIQLGLNPDPARCPTSCSAESSKIKIRTSSRHKAPLGLWLDEVRILIFDDPAEQERAMSLVLFFQLYSN